ncbi:MAG: lysylphosphatidylglycerol synthase transmembrane domain-containing protein [Myxococcaceae bacterium]
MRRAAQILVSVVVTGVLTYWAFRDTDWRALWESLRSAQYAWLLPYLVILLGIHLCRTLRWGYLLAGLERVPFTPLNQASGIGFMMLLLLPFRLGEFARPFLIAQRTTIRRSAAMTTVVLERIVDGILVATLLRGLLFFAADDVGGDRLRWVVYGSNLMFVVFGGGLAFLLFARWQQAKAVAGVRRVVSIVSPELADRAADTVHHFVGALRQLPPAKDALGFLVFTLGYWGLNGFGMSLLARAFSLPVTLFHGYVVLGVLVVSLMIPAAPGMVGTFHAGIRLGLEVFLPAAVVNSQGMAYANVMWLAQTAQQVGLGMLLLSTGHFSFRDVARRLEEPETSTS